MLWSACYLKCPEAGPGVQLCLRPAKVLTLRVPSLMMSQILIISKDLTTYDVTNATVGYLYTFHGQLWFRNLAGSFLPESLGFWDTVSLHISLSSGLNKEDYVVECFILPRASVSSICPHLFLCQMKSTLVTITFTAYVLLRTGRGRQWWKHWSGGGSAGWGGKNGTELIECFVLRIPDPPPVPLVSVNVITAHPFCQAKDLKATFASLFSLQFKMSSKCIISEWILFLFS